MREEDMRIGSCERCGKHSETLRPVEESSKEYVEFTHKCKTVTKERLLCVCCAEIVRFNQTRTRT